MPVRYLDLMNEITAPLPPMPIVQLGAPTLAPMRRPLRESTVLIVSSAGVHVRSDPPFQFVDDLTCRRLDQGLAPTAVRPCHPSPIRRPGRQDINVVHPYQRLAELAAAGSIGRPSPFHLATLGAIKQVTRIVTELGPAVAAEATAAGADLALIVPLCPACHQAMGLLARVVERAGIPTVSVTGARDITERVRPPRAAYLDFPLGYSLGRPGLAEEQRAVVGEVLALSERVSVPGEIVDLPYRWPDEGWQEEVVAHYHEERDIVMGQRTKEFAAGQAAGTHAGAAPATVGDELGGAVPAEPAAAGGHAVDPAALGRHLALDEVRTVEDMARAGLV
ncbi:MAG: hypothetical protein ACRDYZ_13845 [Acidimicrobiales bacterium]